MILQCRTLGDFISYIAAMLMIWIGRNPNVFRDITIGSRVDGQTTVIFVRRIPYLSFLIWSSYHAQSGFSPGISSIEIVDLFSVYFFTRSPFLHNSHSIVYSGKEII